MKLSILLGSAILFATALTPVSAYADDSNLMCRRSDCGSRNGGGGGNLSISGFDINVKSSDRGNNRGNDKRNTVAKTKTNNNIGNGNDDTVDTASVDHSNDDDTDNVDADNDNVDTGGDNTDTVDNNAGSDNTDTGGGNDKNPPQLNSNDVKGFDPSTGLYGPGT
jgi:hypothetical protein